MAEVKGKVNGVKPEFDSIEDSIEAFRSGEFIIVLDSTSRENEGDLILSARHMTPQKTAFMIRHTSGLICTPLSPTLTKTLSLPQMVTHNTESHTTAYTISVDSAHPSVSTGISAHDRALTCRALADPTSTPESFRRPGHVFPLRAREGGVLTRAGHTEAAVDFCRLAGLPEVGVICEIVDDGKEVEGRAVREGSGMSRRDACLEFGRKWGLRVCTIEGLIEYRRRMEGGKGV
ncbi:MAG: 3,4-dihydroxy 2-butanone 4-phosphate synthase [Stictis urceolatum]|nr:3,4-dihydroxy 2-butanone 4-phosphate synthase [Stictis urceolata]